MRVRVRRAARLEADVLAPGDKSISHRALLFGALGTTTMQVRNLAPGADVRSTAACLRALGASIAGGDGSAPVVVRGVGPGGFTSPHAPLDCGNSGTTMRLLVGLVAGARVSCILDGDVSLRGRPMRRVLAPLRAMGARVEGQGAPGDERAPLRVEPVPTLVGTSHLLPIASAQVKSALVLAGLAADGETRVREPEPSRDHTERMLAAWGAPVRVAQGEVVATRLLRPLSLPEALDVPGDPSSAAFWVGAGLLVPGAHVVVRGVDVNQTRTGFLAVLARMGARVELEPETARAGDPVAILRVCGGQALRGTEIRPAEVPSLLDEIPLLAIVASQATGETRVTGAGELRVKESDRLRQLVLGLQTMGVDIDELDDGFVLRGPTPLRGAAIDAAHDHRIAMSFAIAGLVADGVTEVDGAEWADISYPGFFTALGAASGGAVDG
ncbi:MAG: 3-phosphoshikimate 1-carboxyvinyltransferase [Myxococcaceae bacterium]